MRQSDRIQAGRLTVPEWPEHLYIIYVKNKQYSK